MERSPDQDAPFVAAAFLDLLIADRAAGRVRSLAEYQERFPGHETRIAQEFRALGPDAGDEPSSESEAENAGTERVERDHHLALEAFREQYRKDRAEGEIRPLADYLNRFAGQDRALAREFLRLEDAAIGTSPPRPDERIGPFRIEKELGRGGQGVVYLAEDTRLRRRVGLKVVPQFTLESPGRLARFEREAMVASRLNHPGICQVFECGYHRGLAYIAMEYVEGETLARRNDARRSTEIGARKDGDSTPRPGADEARSSLPDRGEIRRIVRILEHVARALHAAHVAGVIHRDIKPGNIMITEGDRPVILDFGLAREVEGDLQTLTRTGDIFGTPSYMAPEQLSTDVIRPDHRADIWALGVCMYECLTLRRPFEEPTRERLYQGILTREPPPPRTANPAISPDLGVIIETALQKNRDHRYQSARSLADDLRAVREGRPISARPLSRFARAWRWAGRRPATAALLLVLGIGLPLLAGLGGFILANRPRWEEQRRQEARRAHEALLGEALHLLLQWNFSGAVETFQEGLAQDPASIEALGGLALVHLRARSPELALSVLDHRPAVVLSSHGLGHIRCDALADLGRVEEAGRTRSGLPPPRDYTDHFLLGLRTLIRMEVNRRYTPGEAFERFTLADELFPHEPRIIYYFARVLAATAERDRRHMAAARRIAGVMARRWPDHHLTWYARGTAEADDRRAIEYLERCLALRPGFVGAYAHLSYRLVSTDPEKALQFADRALERAPNWPWAYAVKARAYRMLDRFDDAMVQMERGIRLSPDDPVLRIQRGRIQVANRDWNAAIETFREAIALNPEYYGGHSWLGYALTGARRFDAAMAAHHRAIALAPGRPWPILQLGRTFQVRGDLEAAIEKYTAAIDLDETNAQAWLMRGLARRLQGDSEGAIADFTQVVALKPRGTRARNEIERTRNPGAIRRKDP